MRLPPMLITRILTQPRRMAALPLADWDLLLRQAYRYGLLARLAVLATDENIDAPPAVQRWLTAGRTTAQRQSRAVHWEAHKLEQALAPLGIPVVLLKGAAYLMADLPSARGRIFSDIDILVPKPELSRVEAALRLHGWHGGHHSDYDQRYYRRWMHELPPLVHIRRQSHLDVHHNLLPETARIQTRPEAVIAAAVALPGYTALRVPCVPDLILHSATHLFHEGEWGHALRDLTDLDALMRHALKTDADWAALWQRAEHLNLTRPLALALRYTRLLLGTPVPETLLARTRSPFKTLGDALFLRGFLGAHPSGRMPGQALAEFLLYVRAHALRMPPHLLLPHLVYKAWIGLRGPELATDKTPP